jgi:cyanate lyase
VELISAARVRQGLRWRDIASRVGRSPEWVTAGCLGQMSFSAEQAATLTDLLGLPDEAVSLLQQAPYRGSLPTTVPTDPLIYRFSELVSVYGTTFKALIEEEFGDGIMSAIDFHMHLEREPDPGGDRVKITMSGKFLPYRQY